MPMNLTESQLEDSYKYEVELVPILEPTALRMDPLYSIYFNWFRFISIGVIPFGLLVSKPCILLSRYIDFKFQMPKNVFKYEEKCIFTQNAELIQQVVFHFMFLQVLFYAKIYVDIQNRRKNTQLR